MDSAQPTNSLNYGDEIKLGSRRRLRKLSDLKSLVEGPHKHPVPYSASVSS